MEQLNSVVNFFKNIMQNQWADWIIALVIIIIFVLISPLLSYIIVRMFKFREKDKKKIKNNAFYKPLKALFITIGVYIGVLIINPEQQIMIRCQQILKITLICILAKALINLVDPKYGVVKKLRNNDMPDGNKTIASFTSKILKYVIYIGAGLLILAVFGINPSSLVAGLGVGSAVVALAAQDFVKNLISGFSIMSDKPFLVGDWISVGTNEGEVVEISFRCTKIRTSDNTVVTMQNSIFNTENIVNWSRMTQRRYLLDIKLPLEINSDKIEKIVNRIKFVLDNDEDVVKESAQVHFNTIQTDGINLNIYMYTELVGYADYLKFREKINEKILKVLESEQVSIAYPGQSVYVHQQEKEENS